MKKPLFQTPSAPPSHYLHVERAFEVGKGRGLWRAVFGSRCSPRLPGVWGNFGVGV